MIRLATMADLEAVCAIEREGFRDLAYLTSMDRRIAEGLIDVDEREGAVAGLVECGPTLYGTIELEALAVASQHRRKGVGRALVRHAVLERGAKFLWVWRKNTVALRLYESEGFCIAEGYTGDMIKMVRKETK